MITEELRYCVMITEELRYHVMIEYRPVQLC